MAEGVSRKSRGDFLEERGGPDLSLDMLVVL